MCLSRKEFVRSWYPTTSLCLLYYFPTRVPNQHYPISFSVSFFTSIPLFPDIFFYLFTSSLFLCFFSYFSLHFSYWLSLSFNFLCLSSIFYLSQTSFCIFFTYFPKVLNFNYHFFFLSFSFVFFSCLFYSIF